MLILCLVLCLALNSFNQLKIKESQQDKEWDAYKLKYTLEFLGNEDIQRKDIFLANCKFIADINAKNLNFTLEMNKFGHLTKHERTKLFLSQNEQKNYQDESPIYYNNYLPPEFDWRREGVVSPVKDQCGCRAGYAFSAVGGIESQFAIHTGHLPDLSEQEIVSCSKWYGNKGCRGGFPGRVFEYCIAKGLSTSIDYPYTAKASRCRRHIPRYSYKLQGFRELTRGDEHNLVRALYNVGPISINMNSQHNEFLFYKSGIIEISDCSPYNLDHAALAVGYNLNTNPYLVVKNSFGLCWGEFGYFKIALFKKNMCGIATQASFPIPLI
ncbi:hypothetical protein MXB_931 [Myxobolus squamalis]|nr:hypothetical protein MXB_931 [Myxobolus squamalis]